MENGGGGGEGGGEGMAITVVTTSCHSEATVVIVLQYMDLKRKGQRKGHHLHVLNTQVIIYTC